MGGSSILYSSRGWGNSFPSRGGEQTCPPYPPPPSLVVFFMIVGGGGILFSLGGGRRPPPLPQLVSDRERDCEGGGP